MVDRDPQLHFKVQVQPGENWDQRVSSKGYDNGESGGPDIRRSYMTIYGPALITA